MMYPDEPLLGQPHPLPQRLQPRIAGKETAMLAIHPQQKPANANRPKMFGSVERFKHTVLVSQASVDFHSARPPDHLWDEFLGLFSPPYTREGAPERRCGRRKRGLVLYYNFAGVGFIDLDHFCGPAQPYAGAQA